MSSIKLTNSVKISSDSIENHGIDVTNRLAYAKTSNVEYTATQDCWVRFDDVFTATIDGVKISSPAAADGLSSIWQVYLKKGQTLKLTYSNAGFSYSIYGLK